MTVEEIFSKLAEHMIQGIMFHEQMANCYGFLTLKGYEKCHEYHYYSELYNYRCLYKYSLKYCGKLIKIGEVKDPAIINSSWYKYTRGEVDVNTKRTAVRDLVKTWVDWEKSTKTLLETSYKELYELGEITLAQKILRFLDDVKHELAHAENKRIHLETVGYDIGSIVGEQGYLCRKYEEKIKCLQLAE